MLLPEALFTYLQTLSVGTNIYPWRLPKDVVLPAISFQVLPGPGPLRVHSDAHAAGDPVGSMFMRTRVQWDCWGRSYLEVEELSHELRHALHGFRGMMGDLEIGSIHVDIELDSYEEDVNVYRRVMDGIVRYNDVIAVGS